MLERESPFFFGNQIKRNEMKTRDIFTEETGLLVFDDWETYTDCISESHIFWLTEEGQKESEDGVLHLTEDGMVKGRISIKELLDCWMEKYGSQEWLGD